MPNKTIKFQMDNKNFTISGTDYIKKLSFFVKQAALKNVITNHQIISALENKGAKNIKVIDMS